MILNAVHIILLTFLKSKSKRLSFLNHSSSHPNLSISYGIFFLASFNPTPFSHQKFNSAVKLEFKRIYIFNSHWKIFHSTISDPPNSSISKHNRKKKIEISFNTKEAKEGKKRGSIKNLLRNGMVGNLIILLEKI